MLFFKITEAESTKHVYEKMALLKQDACGLSYYANGAYRNTFVIRRTEQYDYKPRVNPRTFKEGKLALFRKFVYIQQVPKTNNITEYERWIEVNNIEE